MSYNLSLVFETVSLKYDFLMFHVIRFYYYYYFLFYRIPLQYDLFGVKLLIKSNKVFVIFFGTVVFFFGVIVKGEVSFKKLQSLVILSPVGRLQC